MQEITVKTVKLPKIILKTYFQGHNLQQSNMICFTMQ